MIEAEIVQIGGDPLKNASASLDDGVGDLDVVARACERLRNAMAHQAAAENGDAIAHDLHPAV